MKAENFHFELPAIEGNEIRIVHVEGKQELHKEKRVINTTVSSVIDYILFRAKHLDLSKSLAGFNYSDYSVTFIENLEDPLTITVVGRASVTNKMSQLYDIIKLPECSVKDFISRIRSIRYLMDEAVYMPLLKTLQTFNARGKIAIDRTDNERGSKKISLEQDFQHSLPESITVFVPVINELDHTVAIQLDLCFDVINNVPMMWFSCDSIPTLIETFRETVFKEAHKKLVDAGIDINIVF